MTREQLYTMVSRGRTANHLYLAVGDGDPHRILHTDTQEPTATDILQRVLSRTSLPRLRHHRPSAAADGQPTSGPPPTRTGRPHTTPTAAAGRPRAGHPHAR